MDISMFTTSNWATAPCEERLGALQGLENYFAAIQGRTPRLVHVKNLDESVLGQYSPSKPANILISKELLKNDEGNFMAMDTIIHEGRHAYQDDCIMWQCTPLDADNLSVSGWRENMPGRGGKYYATGFSYRYQPVEADAYRYASIQMDSYKGEFGDDPNYISYRIQREVEDEIREQAVRTALGENFIEIIAQAVSEGYIQICMALFGIQTTDSDGSIGNGGNIMGISTAELVARIKGLQSSSEQLSAVVANASQELVKQANFLAQLTRGSRSGEEAANVVRTSSQSLSRAATTLKSLCQAGDEYIQNAVK